MNSSRYTLKKIVEEGLCFSIPLYQRLFSWGENQIKGLLVDIKEHFSSNKEEKPYYLGMLSCIKNVDRYDLIDGQQRFTVMILISIVLRDYYEEYSKFLNGGERLKFISRTIDNEYLESVIAKQPIMSEPNKKMEEGIEIISNFIKEISNEERRTFAENIYNKMSFFFSELPSSYANNPTSLNKYFEAMNSGGKGLEQHEILKVKLLKQENNKEYLTRIWNAVSDLDSPMIKKEETEQESIYREKYTKAINYCREGNFIEAFKLCKSSYDTEDNTKIGNIEPTQHNFQRSIKETGERCLISFPDFLKMMIDIYFAKSGSYSFYREELLKIYDDSKIPNKEEFYNQILFYRLLLDYYIIYKEGDNVYNNYEIIFNRGEFVEALKQYQSMLYVSQIPFYNWIKPILQKLHENELEKNIEGKDASKILLDWIKEIDNKQHTLPKNIDEMSYDKGIDRYWFWRLDYYLWEARDDYFSEEEDKQIVEEYIFRTNRSIEHLHPQNQEHNDCWESGDIHSFGNLAMMSQSFNSQQQDDPIKVKFARIEEQAKNHSLQSIKMYLMYVESKRSSEGWTVALKNEHQERMYDLLKKSFTNYRAGD